MKAVLQIFAGFIVYAVLGAAEAGLVLLALLEGNPYAGMAIFFITPIVGLCCGLVGLVAAYLIRKRAYKPAAAVSVIALVAVAFAMALLV